MLPNRQYCDSVLRELGKIFSCDASKLYVKVYIGLNMNISTYAIEPKMLKIPGVDRILPRFHFDDRTVRERADRATGLGDLIARLVNRIVVRRPGDSRVL